MMPSTEINSNHKFKVKPSYFKITLMYLSVISFMLGYLSINITFFDETVRHKAVVTFFLLSIILSSIDNIEDIFIRHKWKNYILSIFLISIACLTYYLLGAYGEYGETKFYYLIFILIVSFFSLPGLLKYDLILEEFAKLVFILSLIFCLFSIFFINSYGDRKSEMGLNPAIMARLCMIAGLYITSVIIIKGFTIFRGVILLFSIISVFFTATKTPVLIYLFVVSFIIFKDIRIKKIIKYLFFGLLLFLFIYISLTYFIPKQFSTRILDPVAWTTDNQLSEGNRLDLYLTSFDIITNNPMGNGFGGFAKFHRFIIVPHNIVLEIAVEFGILMAILYLMWGISIFIKISKKRFENAYTLFIGMLYIYMFLSFMLGGELTIQAIFLYITGSYFFSYS